MAVFKCKMCGGTLNIQENDTVAVCDYCGTKQTVPRLSDDRRTNLYDRANHFRRNNEFDKAMGIYEQILNDDQTDAEAYWSLVLCRYGIEYVEDPATHKRVPTVNRTQYTSIFADEDYKSALQYADAAQRAVYEAEAKAIDEIQKGILAISQREKPFDVFICYKETDQNGRRTQDSVLANDLYHQLTQEGFKVFFSRITLEDKLGTAYEPYIFAALHSAKVMVVLGTKPEYFNAVWVKNEWSRYLALIRSGEKKILIPAYRDMDPYDLPEEFSHLQAQDMGKLGFMQDLIRGIRKMLNAGAPTQAAAPVAAPVGTVSAGVDPLLKRAALFLEDGAWDSALEYYEKVLDLNPECAQAYMGRLLVSRQVHREAEISSEFERIEDEPDFQKALRFADGKYREQLEGYANAILERYYQQGLAFKQQGDDEGYEQAIECFELISDYKDSAQQIEACQKLNLEYHRESLYHELQRKKQELFSAEMSESGYHPTLTQELKDLAKEFDKLNDYRDAPQQAAACRERVNEVVYQRLLDRKQKLDRAERTSSDSWSDLANAFRTLGEYRDVPALVKYCEGKETARKTAETKRNRKIGISVLSTVAGVAAVALLVTQVIVPAYNYSRALKMIENENYEEGYAILTELGDYRDASDRIAESEYQRALNLLQGGQTIEDYDKAYQIFEGLGDYKDSAARMNETTYQKANQLVDRGEYEEALKLYQKTNNFGDSEKKIEQCYETIYQNAIAAFDNGDYETAYDLLKLIKSYKSDPEMERKCTEKIWEQTLTGTWGTSNEYYRIAFDFTQRKVHMEFKSDRMVDSYSGTFEIVDRYTIIVPEGIFDTFEEDNPIEVSWVDSEHLSYYRGEGYNVAQMIKISE